uniref:Uncharacterized protein n=1 Tax=Arundo donax TaxID=35708 RepID=A0A0A9FFA9_ARUDO
MCNNMIEMSNFKERNNAPIGHNKPLGRQNEVEIFNTSTDVNI